MKKIAFAALLCAAGLCCMAAENDFAFKPKLPGWQKNNRTVSFDPAVKVSEPGSLKLSGPGSVSRKIRLEPDTDYEFSVYIKAENISGGKNRGVLLRLTDGNRFFGVSGDPKNMPRQGSFDWEKCTRVLSSSSFSGEEITVMPVLTCDGTAWFDDLTIVRKGRSVKPAAKPAAGPKSAAGPAVAPEDADLTFRAGLPGWAGNRGASFDSAEKVSGDGSLKLSGNTSVSRKILLEPGADYEISVYIKAENISGGKFKGVLLRLTDGKKYFAVTGDPKNLPRQGSFDWEKCTRVLPGTFFPGSTVTVMPALTCDGTAWFDDLVIVKKKSSSAAVAGKNGPAFHKAYTDAIRSAALVPGGVFGFFAPGEAVKLDLFVDGKAAKYEYTLTVKDDTGKTVFAQEKKPLSGTIGLPAQPCGYYVAQSDLFADGKKAYTIQGGFAVAPVPGKRDPFFQFGYGVIPELHDGYKRIGCGTIAIKTAWQVGLHLDTPQRTVNYLVNTAYKPFLESGDFNLKVSMGTTLMRAMLLQKKQRTQDELDAGYPFLTEKIVKFYLDFISELAPRLKGKVREWSIGQETPSNAGPRCVGTWSEAMGNFVTLARLGSRRLKKIDPEIRIAAGGNNVMSKTDEIERIAMGDLVKEFDHYFIDAYTGQWNLAVGGVMIPEIELMNFYRKASALSVSLGKGKYISNDETGYAINYGAPFDGDLALLQARLTARSFIISRAAPVLCYELHCPNRPGRPAGDAAVHMATVWKTVPFGKKLHSVPLPGGAMYVTAAAELAFVRSEAEIIHGSIYSYLFTKPDGSTLVTLWNIEKEQPFAVKLPAVERVLNMYGRDLTGKPLVIGPAPLYITVKAPAAQVAEVMKHAVVENSPEAVCTALPGTVFVRSLAKVTRDAEIRFPGKAPVRVKLLPGRAAAFPMEVAGPGKLAIGSREYEIPMEKVPVHTLRRVSGLADLRKGKPGLLRVPDHVRPLEALHPERCYFRSEGFNPNGHDVSAKYWTGYDDKNFYMAVEVDDPVHLQRHDGKEIWRDDSLQFVLSPADYPPSSMLNDTEKKPSSEYNFGLALSPKGVRLVKFFGKDAGVKEYPAKVFRKGNTTVYEVAIPWKVVGGRAKRFGFVVWDNNSPTYASAPYRLEYTPGIGGGIDSSKLAKLKYEE